MKSKRISSVSSTRQYLKR